MELTRLQRATIIYDAGLKKVAITPPPEGQKFPIGSFVFINKDLGESMRHFENNRYAMVQYTYAHAYGGAECQSKSYSLLIRYNHKEWGSVAWYSEDQLTLVEDSLKIKELQEEVAARDGIEPSPGD